MRLILAFNKTLRFQGKATDMVKTIEHNYQYIVILHNIIQHLILDQLLRLKI